MSPHFPLSARLSILKRIMPASIPSYSSNWPRAQLFVENQPAHHSIQSGPSLACGVGESVEIG